MKEVRFLIRDDGVRVEYHPEVAKNPRFKLEELKMKQVTPKVVEAVAPAVNDAEPVKKTKKV